MNVTFLNFPDLSENFPEHMGTSGFILGMVCYEYNDFMLLTHFLYMYNNTYNKVTTLPCSGNTSELPIIVFFCITITIP